jgi:hypothetical protein
MHARIVRTIIRMPNRQQKVIWFAIFTSTIIYAGVAYTMGQAQASGPLDEMFDKKFVIPLYIAAAVAFVAASVLPARIGPPEKTLVVGLAMYESCVIFGLLAAILNEDWRLYIAPWALGLIGFIRLFPSGEATLSHG